MTIQGKLIQNLLDSSKAIIYLKDEKGHFLLVNQKFAEFFQSTIEEIIGKTDYDFAPKDQANIWRAQDRKVTEAGTPMNFIYKSSLAGKESTFIDHKFPVQS